MDDYNLFDSFFRRVDFVRQHITGRLASSLGEFLCSKKAINYLFCLMTKWLYQA